MSTLAKAMQSIQQKRRNVLVLPAGTEIGLEIFNALKDCKEVQLFAGGQRISNHAEFIYSEYHEIPSVHDARCIPALERFVRDFDIDYIFPAHDDVLVELSKAREKISAEVIGPSVRVCELTRSKSKTYEYLRNVVSVPTVYETKAEVPSYPVLVKPDRGQGSFGIVRADTEEQLDLALENTVDPVICEYLPGEEYTVDCFSDRQAGLLFAGPRIRNRTRNGIAVNTETVVLDDAASFAKSIGDKLGMYGAWFFQLKRASSGTLKLLEVAPRIAGSMASHRVSGINFALLAIFEAERIPLSIQANEGKVVLDRALKNRYRHTISYSNVYVDLDDTLISDGMVNLELVKLIFKSINEQKTVVLVTKHEADLEETLRVHRIAGLFDEIIHIKKEDRKSFYMNSPDSVFIDDSFSERMDVYREHGIPTFDSSMIEVLTEGRFDAGI
jgi:hypothetical protein